MSVRKSVMTPVRSRFFLAMSSVLVMVAGMLFGANIAAADSVQVQSYQRASQTATCDSPPESLSEWRASWANPSDPISGPTWHPTWERWANGGKGGWTCTRSITWAKSTPSARSYALGDIGPGGGLVFLISDGLTYEMAPKTWGAAETTGEAWCNNVTLDVSGAVGTAVGTGSANTTAIDAACTSGAGQLAADYSANGLSDWFLPSLDELNAMCNYSRTWVTSPSTGTCTGLQNADFASSDYGFASGNYWSSSQNTSTFAWLQSLADGSQANATKGATLRVRPVRAF
jgi:hypothetical protein